MPGDLLRALGDLRDPRLWGVMMKAALLTLALLALGVVGLGWALGVGGDLTLSDPWIGTIDFGALGFFAYLAAATLASAFLTPFVAALFVGLLLDDVVEAVERRRYPGLGPASPVPFARQMGAAVKLLGLMIVANLLGLAVYLLFPPFAPAVFLTLNGYLIGREYVELVAFRRISATDARRLRRRERLSATLIGAAVAATLSVPFVNLLAPMIGVAAATHLFHRARARAAA